MDHTEAIRIKATEQYLLDELPGELRDEFEEHFMGCGDCSRDVRAGAAFLGNIREAFTSEVAAEGATMQRPTSRATWLAALFRPAVAAPVLAVLLFIVGYQGLVVVPRMENALSKANSPSSLASFSLLSGDSRGQASVPVIVRRDQPFTLYVDVPPQSAFPLYTLDVENANGASQFVLPVSAEEAKNTVQILIPAARLVPDDYVVLIRGSAPQGGPQGLEIGRARFSVKYAEN
jgi:hypothetical protein